VSDLDKLIEAVEAGFPEWGLLEADGLIDGEQADDMHDAYHGSLDAARRLHDALLPGWDWSIGDGPIQRDHGDYSRAILIGWQKGQVEAEADSPARAWLLAALKAYRSAK
jgi:hypothetical protein